MLSVVVPAYNEEGNIRLLHERLRSALAALAHWEVIFVDDGSDDGTWREIVRLAGEHPEVEGLKLSRNFGHQNAILAGLAASSGSAVVCMDADLQHPPSEVPRLVDAWRSGAKVVCTVRQDAESTGLFKRLSSRAYYGLLSFLSTERIYAGMSDFCLLDRAAVDEILRLGEAEPFLRGIVQWVGFPSTLLPYRAGDRATGRTKYSLSRMLRFAVTGITAMSIRPLRLAIVAALLAAGLGVCELAYVVAIAAVAGNSVPGWASTLVVTSFFFTLLFLYLGVLGEYLGRVFENVRGRPRFIVERSARERIDANLRSRASELESVR